MEFSFEEIFEALKKEILILHARWQIYEKVFGKSEDRIDLINRSASSFFYNLQFILLDDIELIISKLLDPAKQGSHANLSLNTVYLLVEDKELQFQLRTILESLKALSEDLRNKRNKRLSHYDLETSVVRTKQLFSKASRKQINEILDNMRKFLNLIEYRYYEKTTLYEFFSGPGDAESLIQCLKRSESYKLLEKQGNIERGFFRTKGPFKDA